MISVTVNGKTRSLDGEVALPQLLEQLDIDSRRIAVAINDEVIRKNQYKNTTVKDGDVVEIVRMVGGGDSGVIARARHAICRIVCPDIGSSGTGFFVSEDLIVTCDHVVSHEVPTSQGLIGREFSSAIKVECDNGPANAAVVSPTETTDPYFYDYALLQVDRPGSTALALADYASIEVGDDLIVLGYPLRSDHLVATRALVAAKPRLPSHQNRIVSLNAVELDGSIDEGNSGGPAIDISSGRAVGIVSVRYGGISGALQSFRHAFQAGGPEWLGDLLDLFEETNRFMNPGLGYAVSTEYVQAERQRLGL